MDESVRDCIPELLGQEKALFEGGQDIRTYSPLALAFIGDAVFSLYIRTMIVAEGNTAPGKLHKRSSELVKAGAQAVMIRGISDELTEEERCVCLAVHRRAVRGIPEGIRTAGRPLESGGS